MISEKRANKLIGNGQLSIYCYSTREVNELGRVWDGILECRELKLRLSFNLSSNGFA